ncbi:MAG: GDYXXLXY domain-containing protein [Kiritimatiellia bacterium]|jgi:uncharacterized membrane-anchored protein
MHKRYLLLGLAVTVAVQLAVPALMIVGHERALREGQVFKFKTRPVDPADAFRGRYVWVSLEPDIVELTDPEQWNPSRKVFAVLETDPDGFALVKRLERCQPKDEPSVQVRMLWHDLDSEQQKVRIQWPGLERYYMPEDQAPAAEAAYLKANQSTNHACYVTVRVRGKQALIENLFIEDQPVQDWLRKQPKP